MFNQTSTNFPTTVSITWDQFLNFLQAMIFSSGVVGGGMGKASNYVNVKNLSLKAGTKLGFAPFPLPIRTKKAGYALDCYRRY